MLVLSRKEEETIIIDTPVGQISIKVNAINGNRVILGIDAPLSLKILRQELVPN